MTSDHPMYVQVADQLEALIQSLPSGQPMPSENELARDHDINRLTARAALEELERRYLVRRAQGRRTIVARRIRYPLHGKGAPGLTRTVKRAGAEPRTEVDAIRLRAAPKDVREALKLAKKSSAFQLARKRFVDDELAAYSESWLAPSLVPDLAERLTKSGSLGDALKKYGLKVKRSLLQCELAIAPPAVAHLLEAPERPLVFVVKTHLRAGKTPFALTTTWLRADVFNVVFEMNDLER